MDLHIAGTTVLVTATLSSIGPATPKDFEPYPW